jgi:hypothetical protein
MRTHLYPVYCVSNLCLFPVYETREEYREATGVEPPPFDSNKPVKLWFDPSALRSTKRKLVYENVAAYAENGAPLIGSDGNPALEPLLIDRQEAGTVNIPSEREWSNWGIDIPVPMRPLDPGEELYFQYGGIIGVRDPSGDAGGAFTKSDRALLRAIAAKLGIGA